MQSSIFLIAKSPGRQEFLRASAPLRVNFISLLNIDSVFGQYPFFCRKAILLFRQINFRINKCLSWLLVERYVCIRIHCHRMLPLILIFICKKVGVCKIMSGCVLIIFSCKRVRYFFGYSIKPLASRFIFYIKFYIPIFFHEHHVPGITVALLIP